MSKKLSKPMLSFLWRPSEINHSVVEVARKTSTGAIFDVSEDLTDDTAKAFKAAGAKDIKISADSFMNQAIEGFLQQSGADTLWIEYHPALLTDTPEAFLERLHEMSATLRCIPISGDLDFLTLTLQSEWHPPAVALKGAEAAGFVGKETIGVLYSTLREIANQGDRKPKMIIWGGVATPEAAAAFLCSGAEGIVFESLHWQTDRKIRERLSRLRPEHTSLVGRNLEVFCRLFDKGNSLAVKELKKEAGVLCKVDVTDQDRRTFTRKVKEAVIPALESDLGRQDLVFLSSEA
ncbi:acyl transferase, partial [Thermodesulfobacteriota bacterium]